MNIKLLILVGIVGMLEGCMNTSSYPSSSIKQSVATDSCQKDSLVGVPLPIDVLYPTDIVVVDTFLLVLQHHKENIINAYSTRSFKKLGSFLKKGGGPNEVVTFGQIAQWFVKDGRPKVVIQSYPNYLGILDIQKSLEAKQTVYDCQYKFETRLGKNLYLASHSVYVLDSLHLMMTKDPVRSGVKRDNNFFWEFYDVEKDCVTRKIVYEDFPKMTSFLKESYRAIKPDGSKMALFYRFFDMVSIADLSTGSVTQILPEKEALQVRPVLDIDTRKLYYRMGKCTNRHLYGLYANGLSVLKEDVPEFDRGAFLKVYDWEGNCLHKCVVSERLRMFALDEQEEYLYGVASSDSIVRYELKQLFN